MPFVAGVKRTREKTKVSSANRGAVFGQDHPATPNTPGSGAPTGLYLMAFLELDGFCRLIACAKASTV